MISTSAYMYMYMYVIVNHSARAHAPTHRGKISLHTSTVSMENLGTGLVEEYFISNLTHIIIGLFYVKSSVTIWVLFMCYLIWVLL